MPAIPEFPCFFHDLHHFGFRIGIVVVAREPEDVAGAVARRARLTRPWGRMPRVEPGIGMDPDARESGTDSALSLCRTWASTKWQPQA